MGKGRNNGHLYEGPLKSDRWKKRWDVRFVSCFWMFFQIYPTLLILHEVRTGPDWIKGHSGQRSCQWGLLCLAGHGYSVGTSMGGGGWLVAYYTPGSLLSSKGITRSTAEDRVSRVRRAKPVVWNFTEHNPQSPIRIRTKKQEHHT